MKYFYISDSNKSTTGITKNFVENCKNACNVKIDANEAFEEITKLLADPCVSAVALFTFLAQTLQYPVPYSMEEQQQIVEDLVPEPIVSWTDTLAEELTTIQE